jgi:serine/threonine-protein kinase
MTDATARLAGALAGRYRLERELGQGGMATVYLAEDLRHRRRVAIKVMKPAVAQSIGADRFLREIEIAARLQHPHIVPVFDSGSADGDLYYVMPLVEGESLRDRLAREGRLPVDEAVRLVREVAGALDYAHAEGVLHRDLKPENIMLSRGHALLADFGIARVAGDGADRLTQTGMSVGTPVYMSPEQSTGERELGPPSDVYGLGCILYELLAGTPPFTGATYEAILVKRFTQDAPRIRTARADTPPAVESTIARALARAPEARFATAQAFADALVAAPSTTTPTVVLPVTGAPSLGERSIMVLPFENRSPDPDNEFFADGLTEEIISDLGKVRALNVLSRTSSMQLKGSTKPLGELGRELGVRYALTGSVRRAGPSLRITAELVDTASGRQLWGDKYAGTMDDVFDVQERVSREIVRALDVTLSADEERRLADRPVADPRAFELFLQARQALRHYKVPQGVALLERAIAIEGPVPALRFLRGLAHVIEIRTGMNRDLTPLDLAEAEARALVADAPDAPYGYALLGFIGYERGNLKRGVAALYDALERDPNDADVLFFLGISLTAAGQCDTVIELARKLVTSDPLSPLANMLAGVAGWFIGRAAEGLANGERSVELDPDSLIGRWTLGYQYALLGRPTDAAAQERWLAQHAPDVPYSRQLRGLLAALDGRRDEALALVNLVDTSALDGHNTFHIAEVYAMAGDAERALVLCEQAVDGNFYPLPFLATHCPFLAPVRALPGFARVLAKAERRMREFEAA